MSAASYMPEGCRVKERIAAVHSVCYFIPAVTPD